MNVLKCCCASQPNMKNIVLLLVGLDNAGKTTAVKGLAKKDVQGVLPTVGFSKVTLRHGSYSVTIYDLGGGRQIRGIWPQYYNHVHGVIFVVDASDPARLQESRLELENLLKNDKIAEKPVLVLGNKEDLSEAMDELDMTEKLCIEPLVNMVRCPTRVQMCTAHQPQTDQRLLDGYRWLIRLVIKNYKELNRRVLEDSRRYKEDVRQRREAWRISRHSSQPQGLGLATSSSCDDSLICNGVVTQVAPELHQHPAQVHPSPQPSITSPIREQLENISLRRKKPMSARTRRSNRVAPSSQITPNGVSGDKETPRLGLLPAPLVVPPAPQPPRPLSTKSLGRNGAWDLHVPLEVIVGEYMHPPSSPSRR